MTTTYANGRSVLHAGDGNTQTAAAPDVCKTPSPGGPVPVPYGNVARDSDLAEGSTSVEIDGHPVALKGSYLSTSTGDEAGTAGGGLVSSKIQGRVVFLTASLDVLVEGQGVVRFLDTFLANANTGNTLGLVYGDPLVVPKGRDGEEPTCDACGKPFSEHPPGLESSEEVRKEMRLLVRGHQASFKQAVVERENKGFMLGVLKCRTRDGRTVHLRAMSGMFDKELGIALDPTFEVGPKIDGAKLNKAMKIQEQRLAERPRHGFRMKSLKGENPNANPPGNCAAPRLLLYAMDRGWEPVEMVEQWFGPATEAKEHGQEYPPCETCRRLVPVLLCEARERARNEPTHEEGQV
ncbi:DUF4150 domain-containing protein [Myxococcus sp. RHSTA-1-4]|uniref:DUF4150 domain-containing protein n=1 Tax=Myxococcus sp. RHSTA-1-4 TaxID=2874601 RepID=UPI001CC14F58|nr:DUF4150 domain-containing protein [Myxococcus sp. RHSTA-1-4]MBZ4417983.1 DUF4150 domain-containing protein [Myxococcus sp. RHSTA-1-4]